MIIGMTVFLILPFTRLVHIWSGFATLYYAFRPYQVVRRRISIPDVPPEPTRRGSGM
jgi:nitrate reductase gamma subunit